MAPFAVLCFTLFIIQFANPSSATVHKWQRKDIIRTDVAEEETALTPEDFINAEEDPEDLNLNSLGVAASDSSSNPHSLDLFEGDIKGVTTENLEEYIKNSNALQRNAISNRWRHWPNNVIPYTLSSRYGSYSRRTIAKAMNEYHKKTCIEFVPRDANVHRDYVYIHPDDGCYSLVGRTGGRQPLSLDAGCIQTGTIIHELMHSVGFFHEQSRNDRNDWITIVWDNVITEAKDQFEKYSLRTITHLGVDYDYGSIMHYGSYAFSKNGRKTILARRSGGGNMGQRTGFSDTDLAKINKLYSCDTTESSGEGTTRAPKIVVNKECKNKNWRCSFWALKIFNYCNKYRSIREDTCPKACGTCSQTDVVEAETTTTPEPTTPIPTTPTAPTAVSKKCRDKNPNCRRWSDNGFCDRDGYKGFMKKTCAKSCSNCAAADSQTKQTDDDCEDAKDSQCGAIKSLGYCRSRRFQRYVEKKCRKSCDFC